MTFFFFLSGTTFLLVSMPTSQKGSQFVKVKSRSLLWLMNVVFSMEKLVSVRLWSKASSAWNRFAAHFPLEQAYLLSLYFYRLAVIEHLFTVFGFFTLMEQIWLFSLDVFMRCLLSFICLLCCCKSVEQRRLLQYVSLAKENWQFSWKWTMFNVIVHCWHFCSN